MADTSTPRVTIGKNTGMNGGSYPVLVDGVEVGAVTKYRKTYNLVRLIVDEGWDLRATIDGRRYETSDSTRKGAVAQLESFLSRPVDG